MRTEADRNPSILRYVIQICALVVIFSASLFFSSGTLNWLMGWSYLGLVAASQGIMAIVLVKKNPDLASDRTQLQGKRDLDRVLAGVMALYGPICICIISGLNHRYGWQPYIPLPLQVAALGVAVTGTLITMWAMATNKFFYSVMRIEKEKGHTVCTNGPYRYIRHPGYLGALLFDVATPLMLGSIWALIPSVVTVYAIAVRTVLEDRTLQNELDGYKNYTQQVGDRLLPNVW